MSDPRIVIIGAGMAGIACARALSDAGLRPVVVDKGRSPGGRMSTRRVDGFAFDHGAQFFTARGDAFRSVVRSAQAAGAVARWDAAETDSQPRYVGMPGMSGLVKHMATGLDVRCGVEVSQIERQAGTWLIVSDDIRLEADIVVCTAPVHQSRALLASHGWDVVLSRFDMEPCWALMLCVPEAPEIDVITQPEAGAFAWIARNDTKPGRTGGTLVLHASPEWSREHLEMSKDDAANQLLMHFRRLVGSLATPIHLSAHRWRYARVSGTPRDVFLYRGGIYAGGDWALGPRVECAFDSGNAIAKAILES